MLAGGKLDSPSSLQVTFTEVKGMIRILYVTITKREGSGERSPPDVGTVTQISAPLLLKSRLLLTPLSRSIFRVSLSFHLNKLLRN